MSFLEVLCDASRLLEIKCNCEEISKIYIIKSFKKLGHTLIIELNLYFLYNCLVENVF